MSSTYFLDTNIILRFIVGDIPEQQKQAREWFEEAENGNRTLILTPMVVAEVCFVLESFYEKNRKEIAETMKTLIAQTWIEVEQRGALLTLWEKYLDSFHFVDSFLLARAELTSNTVLTFDAKMNATQS